jgi:hypothetical protein
MRINKYIFISSSLIITKVFIPADWNWKWEGGFGGECIYVLSLWWWGTGILCAHHCLIVSLHKAVPSVTNTVKSVLLFHSHYCIYHISRRRVMQRPYLLSSFIISSCTIDRRVDVYVMSVDRLCLPVTLITKTIFYPLHVVVALWRWVSWFYKERRSPGLQCPSLVLFYSQRRYWVDARGRRVVVEEVCLADIGLMLWWVGGVNIWVIYCKWMGERRSGSGDETFWYKWGGGMLEGLE